MKTAGVTLDDEVMGIFRRYPWPGNIRELAHVIEGSLALLDGSDIITVHNLPRHFREACNLQPADDDLRPPLPNMMRAEPQMPVSAATTPDYFDYRGIPARRQRLHQDLPARIRIQLHPQRTARDRRQRGQGCPDHGTDPGGPALPHEGPAHRERRLILLSGIPANDENGRRTHVRRPFRIHALERGLQEGAHQADRPGHADDDQQDLAEGLLRDALGHGEGQQRAQDDTGAPYRA